MREDRPLGPTNHDKWRAGGVNRLFLLPFRKRSPKQGANAPRSPLYRATLIGLLLGLLGFLSPLPAQQPPQPPPGFRVTTLTPAGGKAGTSVEVTLGGTEIEQATHLHCNHPGIKAERIPPPATGVKFKVTVAADVPVGIYDLRAVSKNGVSNLRAFAVGDLNEAMEKEPNNDLAQAQTIELNTTVSGTVNPNVDVDYYGFQGKKGQRVVVVCHASAIDSRLDPFVQLFDGTNRQLASGRRYRDRDAVLDAVLPADGEYYVRVCEFTHLTGGAEHFYRLTISLGPWIDAVFPPVVELGELGEPGKPTQVTLHGRNLPEGKPDPSAQLIGRPLDRLETTVTPPARTGSSDGFEHRVRNAIGTSNPCLIGYASAPVILDNGSNESSEQAQDITVPCELCGRIEQPRERDWYAFTAKQGDVLIFEGFADRLRSPMDLYLEVRRADNGQMVGEYDENVDVPPVVGRFYQQTDDPKGRFVAPANGRYFLMVSSRNADLQAGPRHVYRVSIRKESPDFRLILVGTNDAQGSACAIRKGGAQELTVHCLRQEGFAGEVILTAEGLPPGVTCTPQVMPPNVRQTSVVLRATDAAAEWLGEIRVIGTATINGEAVVRAARAGSIVWPPPGQPQQNIPGISRIAKSICLAVRDAGPFTLDTPAKEVDAVVGSTVSVRIQVNRGPDFKAPVQISRVAAPPQANGQPINIANITIAADKTEGEVRVQIPANTPLGVYNLVFQGVGQVQIPDPKDATGKAKKNVNLTELVPAIRLTVLKPGSPVSSAAVKSTPLVAESAEGWKYLAASQSKGDAWRAASFDDGKWKTAKAPFGYGEEEIQRRRGTQLDLTGQNVLFRRTFELPADLVNQKGVTFQLAVASDDSADVFINGERADQDPEADHELQYWNREIDVDPKLFKPGKNVVAVLVKNKDGSSDLFMDLKLSASVPMAKAAGK